MTHTIIKDSAARPCRQQAATGSSLLEVLIAAVILGIGLLGISSLQLRSLQATGSAEYRGRAADIASSLADRMRANKPARNSYLSTPVEEGSSYCLSSPAAICSMSIDGVDASALTVCTPQQLATFDLWEIRCSGSFSGIKHALPGGQLAISKPSGERYRIQISWLMRTENSETESRDTLSMTVIPGTKSVP